MFLIASKSITGWSVIIRNDEKEIKFAVIAPRLNLELIFKQRIVIFRFANINTLDVYIISAISCDFFIMRFR